MLITAHPPFALAAHRAMSSLTELVRFVEDDSFPAVTRAYALCVGYGWASTPMRSLDRERWVKLFSQFGFITNRPDVVGGPQGTVRLYRAATTEFKRGLSWSDSREYAERYLARRPEAGPHQLYACLVEPDWVLAVVQRTRRDGRARAVEWIVDVPARACVDIAVDVPASKAILER
ncbi:hypothetical protein [Microbacterium sp.]|uniref:hypothetical protein n=1 Tax=Microbacterium sp. TaxID=51671 RepID=UPI003565173F